MRSQAEDRFEICGEVLHPSDELLRVTGNHMVKRFKVLPIGGGFFGGKIEQNSFLDTSGQNEGYVSITLRNICICLETRVTKKTTKTLTSSE